MARSTADLIVLIVVVAIVVVLVVVTVGLVVYADDVSSGTTRAVAESVGGVLSLMVGGVLGYVLRDRRDSGPRPPTDSP